MSHRIKLTTLAILGILLAIAAGYLVLAARVRDPLQFRLLHVPVFVNSSTVNDTFKINDPFEMELRNTSSFPIVLHNMEFEDRRHHAYEGVFTYVTASGMEAQVLSYSQITIAGHETLRIRYDPGPFAVPAMVADKPDIRYNWKPSVLDKLESGLKDGLRKYGREEWSEHLPDIEVTSTLTPLDVSTVRPPSPSP